MPWPNARPNKSYNCLFLTCANPAPDTTRESFLTCVVDSCGANYPDHACSVMEPNNMANVSEGHHRREDGLCYHYHAILFWHEQKPWGMIARRLKAFGYSCHFNAIHCVRKQPKEDAYHTILNYIVTPSKDKIVDPLGPCHHERPAFGSKEYMRLDVMKARVDRWGTHHPAPIHWIRKIYGSFDAWYEYTSRHR